MVLQVLTFGPHPEKITEIPSRECLHKENNNFPIAGAPKMYSFGRNANKLKFYYMAVLIRKQETLNIIFDQVYVKTSTVPNCLVSLAVTNNQNECPILSH